MAATLDPALLVACLGLLGACVVAALHYGRLPEGECTMRPWAARGWLHALSAVEQQEARARALEVAQLTVGEETWSAFERDGYIELCSAREPGTCYRLRPARRVEIQTGALAAPGPLGRRYTRTYLCVYPTYELPAVEFMAQLYLRLRDDEQRVLATGRLQPGDGPVPNVF